MIPRVAEARYVRDFTIHLRFTDGTEGDVDLQDELYGEVFEPLKDRAYFQQFSVIPNSARLPGQMAQISPRNSCTRKSNLRRNAQQKDILVILLPTTFHPYRIRGGGRRGRWGRRLRPVATGV